MRPAVDLRLVPPALVAWACAWAGAPAGAPTLRAAAACCLALAGVLLAVHAGVVRRDRDPGRDRGLGLAALTLAVACAVLAAGGAAASARASGDLPELARDGASVEVLARVVADPEPVAAPWADEPQVRTLLRLVSIEHGGRTTAAGGLLDVSGGAEWAAADVGATILVEGRLRPGRPGEEPVARLVPASAPRVVDPPGALLRGVDDVRTSLLEVTDGLSPQARGLVPGAAVGDTTRVPDDVDAAMLATSLTHITAVSGGHFAIVVASLAWCCALLRVPRAARTLVTALAVVAFVALVRPDPSVLRAAGTGAVALVAACLGRPARAVPALAACVVVLLVADPWLARSYGFVLSVAATAGLVTLTTPISRRLAPWCGRPAAFALAVPVAAQVACAPILVLLSPSVAVYAVPANLVAAVALAPATVLGVLAALLAPWCPVLALPVAWCAGLATWWIATTARVFAALPGAAFPWLPGVPGVLLMAALTAVALGVLRRGWPVAP
ncbi:ComEC/Rec2 family competence protein [Cellulomonas sp. PhB143]|uniref:ComEC/Rec2 family competence protein n=1 Tax=Cellulomonas sp. PhB143 TaxID=2485186 RepID=UPI000F467599|nr:ComEC/Rec2 family competence protein [Cellulomonas sp. PhB143]ROS73646.1 competence protein ComEC [Cellulomonas sp. PhB143]